MEKTQYELRFGVHKTHRQDAEDREAQAENRTQRKEKWKRRRQAQKALAKEVTNAAEREIILGLAAAVKLAICGFAGSAAVAIAAGIGYTWQLWAAACAGCIAYRWISRIITIEPKKRQNKKTLP